MQLGDFEFLRSISDNCDFERLCQDGLPKMVKISLEALFGYLAEIPSHEALQKV
jgi:hypothetical protein